MADREYNVRYHTNTSNAIAGIDKLIAKINALDARVEKSKKTLAELGRSMPGVIQSIASIGKLARALDLLDAMAGKATAGVKKVGQGTGALTDAATKTEKLTKNLIDTEGQAVRAATALKEVGANIPGAMGGGMGRGIGGGGGPGVKPVLRAGARVAGGMAERAIHATVGAYAASQEEVRDFQNETAQKAFEFRNSRRELAGLMGHSSPDGAVLKSSLDLMRSAGMSSHEEAAFSTEYMGSAAIGRDKGNLGAPGAARDALEEGVKRVGAQFTTRVGLDAKTGGDLTGMVGAYSKIKTPEDAAGQLAGLHYGLDQGRGVMTPLTRAALSQAGAAISDDSTMGDLAKSGRISGLPEMGAWIGVMSSAAKGAGSSGTNYGQLSRMLNKVSGPEGEFLKKSGVAGAKTDLGKLDALDKYFKDNGITDYRGFLASDEGGGFGNEQDLKAVTHALNQREVLHKRVDEANARAKNPGDFLRKNTEFKASTLGIERSNEAVAEAAEIERGTTAEAMISLRRQGHAARMAGADTSGAPGTSRGAFEARMLTLLGAGDGEQELDDIAGIRLLSKRFKAVGADLAADHPELVKQVGAGFVNPFSGQGRTFETTELREREVGKATAEVEQLEKAAKEQKAAADALNEAARNLNRAAGQMGGQPGRAGAVGAVKPGRP